MSWADNDHYVVKFHARRLVITAWFFKTTRELIGIVGQSTKWPVGSRDVMMSWAMDCWLHGRFH